MIVQGFRLFPQAKNYRRKSCLPSTDRWPLYAEVAIETTELRDARSISKDCEDFQTRCL